MTEWISVLERLPAHQQLVLIKESGVNVHMAGGVLFNVHVAQFIRGRIPGPIEPIRSEDQSGNNLVPYYWNGDGPCSWFGQCVTHWSPLEPPTKEEQP